jgi:hypothetical protein
MQTFNAKTEVQSSSAMFWIAGVAILSYVLGTFSGYYWKALNVQRPSSTKKPSHFKEEANSGPQVELSDGNLIVSRVRNIGHFESSRL